MVRIKQKKKTEKKNDDNAAGSTGLSGGTVATILGATALTPPILGSIIAGDNKASGTTSPKQ